MAQNIPHATLKALTDWWTSMGVEVDEARIEALKGALSPVDSGAEPARMQTASQGQVPRATKSAVSVAPTKGTDWFAVAQEKAKSAQSLSDLKAAIESFDGSPLKALCSKTVVYDGVENAPVMVIGEGPGGQEDRIGLPFVGKAGQLLDKMLAAIHLDRKTNCFITNVNYWRPPGNRNPEEEELAVCRPFVGRMIDLGQPKLILIMGGVAAKTLLNTRTGIMRLRGQEHTYTTPVGTEVLTLPMFHPAYLLRRAQDKSRAWRDLLAAQARLRDSGVELRQTS